MTWPVFFNGLEPRAVSIGAKLISTNDRPSMFAIILRLFPSGGEKTIATRFARPGWRSPRQSVEMSAQKIEDLTCLSMFNIKTEDQRPNG